MHAARLREPPRIAPTSTEGSGLGRDNLAGAMASPSTWSWWALAVMGCVLLMSMGHTENHVQGVNVSYDHRALLLDGQRRMLISGSIHYPRSTPQMWPDLIAKAKKGGLDVIQTYVFWDVHEPSKGVYNFDGRYNLPQFLKLVQEAGMYANLRIGPYVCAEWNSGGFPDWLRFVPNIEFRTDNEPFKAETQRFVETLVTLLKMERLFAWQGGPIILAQIENEYGNIDASYGEAGQRYLNWIANMAVATNTGVPWTMCQQPDAPDSVINTCNGFYCDGWKPISDKKPIFWTENWTGWFHSWGGAVPTRPVQDIAFAVARFFQRGGSYQNYYMYHGGTNFGRTSVETVTTTYDYDAPIDEYGDIRQPKWGHLKDLHAALKLCEPALVGVDDIPPSISLGPNQEAHVYRSSTGACAAFLASWDSTDTTVKFQGQSYILPAWSVSILPDCKSVVFNTAKVGAQTVTMSMQRVGNITNWQSWNEPVGQWGGSFVVDNLVEQINATKHTTDYLWYITTVQVADTDVPYGTAQATLVLNYLRDAAHVFVNGVFAEVSCFKQHGWWVTGTVSAFAYQVSLTVRVSPGINNIAILSMTTGLEGNGPFLEHEQAGVLYGVSLQGLPSGSMDLTRNNWTYQVGLKGEALQLYTVNGSKLVSWNSKATSYQPLVWYKTTFDAPEGNATVALDLGSMRKGQVWVNGANLGRYWTSFTAQAHGCSATCDYRGTYNESKCVTNCGVPSQQWYHVPREWLLPTGNLLVLIEEKGGYPQAISFAVRSPQQVCSHITESHPFPLSLTSWTRSGIGSVPPRAPLSLECAAGQRISHIRFASYGTPSGACGNFQKSSCHAPSSYDVLNKACVGEQKCLVPIVSSIFGDDPCPGQPKSLAVAAECA